MRAEVKTWSGAGADANWTTAGNWAGGAALVSGDSLVFGATPEGKTDLINTYSGSSFILSGITFTADAPTYTLSPNWTKLTGDIVNNSVNAQNVNLGHELHNNVMINAAAGDINIGGIYTINLNGKNLTVTGSQNTAIGIAIGGANTTNLTKTGTGVLSITADATKWTSFGGNININEGELIFTKNDLFGNDAATPAVTINLNGGTMSSKSSFTTLMNINLNGGTINCNGGVYDGYRSFYIKGTVKVSGTAPSYMTQTAAAQSGIHLYDNTFDVADGNDLIVTALLMNRAGGAVSGFTKTGAGTMSLQVSNSFTGNITVNGGTLVSGKAGALGANAARTITVNAGGTLRFDSHDTFCRGENNTDVSMVVNGGTLESNNTLTTLGLLTLTGGTIRDNGGANEYWKAFNLKKKVTVNGGVTSSIVKGATGSNHGVQLAGAVEFDVADGSALDVSASLSNASGGTGGINKTGAGTMTLLAANSFTSGVAVNGGTLVSKAKSALGNNTVTRNITVGEGAVLRFDVHDTFGIDTENTQISLTVNGGTLESNNTLTTLGSLTLNGGTILDNGGANASGWRAFNLKQKVTVTGGTTSFIKQGDKAGAQLQGVHLTGVVEFDVAEGSTLEVSSSLYNAITSSAPAGGILKTGAGTMTLSGTNAFTGGITVTGGTLNVLGNIAAGLELNGGTFSPGNSTLHSTAKSFQLDGGTALFEFGETLDDGYDKLFIEDSNAIALDSGTVDLLFTDESIWNTDGAVYQLIAGTTNYDNTDFSSLLAEAFRDTWGLVGRTDGIYLVAAGAPVPGVPEPSAMILLILGAAGMFCFRRKKRS